MDIIGTVEPHGGFSSPSPRCPGLSLDSHMDAQGYKWVRWRVWSCRLAALLSLGLLLVLFRWRPRVAVLARCTSCPVASADVLLIRDSCGQQHVVEVLTEEVEEGSLDLLGKLDESECRDTVQLYKEEKTLLRFYLFEGLRYIWLDRKGAFCRVSVLNEGWTYRDLHRFQKGLDPVEQSSRRHMFGSNLIDVPVKSYMKLLLEEVLNPFYVFQVFSITLWMIDEYYYYALCIFVISIISISVSLYETRRQSITLRNMARLVTKVTIRRDSGVEESVSSEELVPGDCLIIPPEGLLMPCDAALLVGECLVNESMLTGESVPVLKTPLPSGDMTYSSDSERRHTLFCGTQLIQAKGGGLGGSGGAVAVVTNTGFFTAKGHLVSSILYPQPIDFRFYRDSAKFLLILGFIASIGTIYIFVVLYRTRVTWLQLIVRSLDVVTIAVPPALPAAITTGTIYAQSRLKSRGIFCISPPRINVCGKVSLFCFDKTGTLTEEGLDVWGVMEAGPAGFSDLVPDPGLLAPGSLQSGLACCHTVTLLDGQALGDPLELKMVESVGWTLQEPEAAAADTLDAQFGGCRVLAVMRPPPQRPQAWGASEPVAIVQRFPFSSALQRMSVVTVAPGGRSALAFMKGSPEMVASLCRAETVPAQFASKLHGFSSEGLRVLALACKSVQVNSGVQHIERTEVERDMQFLGLMMMKNLVKAESPKVINTLRLAQIRSVMVTGDNVLTAVNVAKSCGMVGADEKVIFVTANPNSAQSAPTLKFSLEEQVAAAAPHPADGFSQNLYQGGSTHHFAINGKSFAALCDYFPEYLPKVLMQATVFARMAPDQKTQLVKELQKLNYRVGMCGDGANDCGALRAADVGVSLSEAEASVASPFTSKTENISCVPLLIREGRCSLVTSFSLFRYMALYSLIQFCSVLLLNTVKTNVGDLQFLFCDLFLVTLLAIVMGRGGPSEELHPCRPPASLLALPVFGSLFIHVCMVTLGQLAAFFITTSQDWYVPLNSTVFGTANLPNMENTCVFTLSGFQYIIMAAVVTKAYPHKKPLYHNKIFLLVLLLHFAVMLWLALEPGPVFARLLQLYDFTDLNFKMLLVAVAALNFLVCFVAEMLVDLGILNCLRCLRGTRQSKKRYKRLKVLLSDSSSWPPLNQTLSPTDHTAISCS
ncbi:putative cation-transporting ATPase 13A2 [Oryzias melastigma]|uniref:Polyamine-transporting ATPase 13A2 n=2 Tax=Oryzias melastigma TaxID=30732 RepID=A0A834C7F3_ORYME|nr:cation-transporting ATPase 13A2 isoform X1 [Oryzias melastigma]KAF6721875.1 putative cation-transporting ATPase 13A2 [Oryzias melastigma]